MALELVVVVLLILLNGFFALSEMSVVVARRVKLRQMSKSSRRARLALELAEQPENFLATVQIGMTLTGILTGLVGGAVLSGPTARLLVRMGMHADLADPFALALSVVVITFAMVMIGELLPKRVALLSPEIIASNVAFPMRLASRISAPFVWLLSRCLSVLLRVMGLNQTVASRVSEEEIRILLAESHEQGLIDADERKMMSRVMLLGDRTAENLMTPRTRIAWLDIEAPLDENLEVLRHTPYSCYPVYRGSDNDVVGILETKSLATLLARGKDTSDIFSLLSDPVFVSESTPALTLLEIFRDNRAHVALVVDEYGDLQGLISRNDVFGAVLGRLRTRMAQTGSRAWVTQRDDGSYLIDGSLSSDDLRDVLNLSQLPGQHQHDFNTAAGMVFSQFGRIPTPGEFFIHENWRIEVIDLDGARIDKLLFQPLPEPRDPNDRS